MERPGREQERRRKDETGDAAGQDVEERLESVVAHIYIWQRQKDRADYSPSGPVCPMNGYKSVPIASI